jgi:hypothetical protein
MKPKRHSYQQASVQTTTKQVKNNGKWLIFSDKKVRKSNYLSRRTACWTLKYSGILWVRILNVTYKVLKGKRKQEQTDHCGNAAIATRLLQFPILSVTKRGLSEIFKNFLYGMPQRLLISVHRWEEEHENENKIHHCTNQCKPMLCSIITRDHCRVD